MEIECQQEGDPSRALRFAAAGGVEPLRSRDGAEKLTKWGLAEACVALRFRYAGALGEGAAALLDFFNDADVQAALAREGAGERARLVACPRGAYSRVEFEALHTTAVDLGLFQRLKERRLVAEHGGLRKCMDETYDGATVGTLLGDLLLNPESEHAGLFSEADKRELLYVLLRWLCVGGALNQCEDNIQPYYDLLKQLYKALVTVVKRPDTNAIEVTSKAYLVRQLDGSHEGLFAEDNTNNLALLVFSPASRTVTYLNSSFIPFLR